LPVSFDSPRFKCFEIGFGGLPFFPPEHLLTLMAPPTLRYVFRFPHPALPTAVFKTSRYPMYTYVASIFAVCPVLFFVAGRTVKGSLVTCFLLSHHASSVSISLRFSSVTSIPPTSVSPRPLDEPPPNAVFMRISSLRIFFAVGPIDRSHRNGPVSLLLLTFLEKWLSPLLDVVPELLASVGGGWRSFFGFDIALTSMPSCSWGSNLLRPPDSHSPSSLSNNP